MASRRSAALSLAFFLGLINRPLRLPPAELPPEVVWRGSNRAISRKLGLRPSEYSRLDGFRKSFDPLAAEEKLSAMDIMFAPRGEEPYPDRLALIHDPPAGLFIHRRGGERKAIGALLNRPRVAIVGARAASRYGLDAAVLLANGMSEASVCIVSGMALGIDAAAHRGAVSGPGGSIAILGCGVDVVYPPANRKLYQELAIRGAIISEYPPGTRVFPWRFPARNRIIAGLSSTVIVVEARKKSGALITADFCLEHGGEVCAVPGSILSELSAGPNRLIRDGATAVTGADDVLELLGMEPGTQKLPNNQGTAVNTHGPLEENDRKVLDALDDKPRTIDEILIRTGVGAGEAATALLSLELAGLVRAEPGQGYSRSPCRR